VTAVPPFGSDYVVEALVPHAGPPTKAGTFPFLSALLILDQVSGFWSWIERSFETEDDDLPAKADVIIAIGADVSRDGKSASPYSRAIAEKAVELYRQGKASAVLLVGGNSAGGVTEAGGMALVVADCIPRSNLLHEAESRNTIENAKLALPILQTNGWTSAIVVAQQWHARRVRAIFRKRWGEAGIRVFVVKAHSNYGGGSQLRLAHFLAFFVWDTVGFLYAKLRGYG
jgi:uncharacterized SAM-binding protein YcdF (DUF218 family)